MILRLSHRLARRIRAGEIDELPLGVNRCADWSCRLFVAERVEYVIVCNTVSMYSCVMSGKDITNRDHFVQVLLEKIGEFMNADEQQLAFKKFVAPIDSEVVFATSLNPSVTKSIADQVHGAKLYLSDGLPPEKIGFRLNSTRLTSLTDSIGRRFAKPRDVFVRLADAMHG